MNPPLIILSCNRLHFSIYYHDKKENHTIKVAMFV